jgi:oxygen-independent coproporphyrinogen-3 oxidase
MYSRLHGDESYETIFFGGGTPSLMTVPQMAEIMNLLRSSFVITREAEITAECNPGTVDVEKLAGYQKAGLNRLSFGVQSFFQDDLDFLSRIHTADEAREAFRAAKEAGFSNLNVDLIFALPGQTQDRWKQNLESALALETKHISAYSLIVEDNTPLARMVRAKTVSPLPLDAEADLYDITMATLAENGFEHYEVSNYAKPGFASRHNCNYWNHTNYLGFGPSAHSFWEGKRWWNIANIQGYCGRIEEGRTAVAGEETLEQVQYLEEAVMLGLRSGGIDLAKFERVHSVDLLSGESASLIREVVAQRLAVLTSETLKLTDKGFPLCDEIAERLLSSIMLIHQSPEIGG